MSHRELRNLTEMLRALGYPHLVSMQSFKTPNFELVADVLHWLVERYDSSISIDDNIETEADRVHFLKATAAAMMLKGRIKLNLKNLYSANGFAVKELLKVAAVLHDAHRGAGDGDAANDASDELVAADAVSSAKFADLKTTRTLAADIVRHGAKLHELLALHPENRELHSQALSRSFEVSDVQRRLAQQAEGMAAQVEEMDKMLANVTRDEAALRAKIDKRKAELERHEKRLSSLAAVRPAFLDEYERLERTLTAQYDAYLSNWRNLQFLEGELDAVHAAEQEGLEAHERQMRAMQKQLREEELRLLRGQADIDEQAIDEALLLEAARPTTQGSRGSSRNGTAGGGQRQGGSKRPGGAGLRRGGSADGRGGSAGLGDGRVGAVVGSMNPHEEDEDDEQSDDDDEENGGGGRAAVQVSGARRAAAAEEDEDEDEEGLIDDDDQDEEEEEEDDDDDDDDDEDGEGDDAGSDDAF